MGREGEEMTERCPEVPGSCQGCAHYGFSFSCVEGYCTLKGAPVDGLGKPCEDFKKEEP